jgi:hypothetical protein
MITDAIHGSILDVTAQGAGHAAEAGGAPPIAVFKELEAARDWLKM